MYDGQVFSQQFSLTSFNCSCVQLNKFPLINFSLTSFICSCVRHKLKRFSLTRSLVQLFCSTLFMSAFEQKAPCQGKTYQFMSYTRANKTCQGKTCQFMSYTRANKTCQGKTCQFMSCTRANKTCRGKICQGKLGRLCGTLI